jgi:hypothetical protein
MAGLDRAIDVSPTAWGGWQRISGGRWRVFGGVWRLVLL